MHISKFRLTIPALILFLLISQWNLAEARKRDTKTLKLENGLEVLLMHDPEVHRSAAALSVGVGHLYDPVEKMGLAHYLEHMLFLGTKKFPEVGSFKKYLDANSGGSNAYTSSVVTNYFFQVSHGGFVGAVDRFSDFFKSPLFDKKYAEREVNAVSSEHDKNKLRDGWRASYVIGLVAKEGHPISKFGTGNKDTLAGDNRPALLDFYKKYYVASRMKLAILSKLSLKEQEDLARKYFADIPDRETSMPAVDSEYREKLKGKYRLLKIKAVKDVRSLTLEFPTIRLHDHLEGKPASIAGAVLGYEGKGSLLSKLKEEGLALGLSAGGGYSHPNLSSFSISVSLTQKGLKEYERILELIFSYINLIKKQDFKEYTFKEVQSMAQINFDWKDPDEGMGYAASRAGMMQNYKLEDIETLPFLYRKYDPSAYKAILDTLTPENMLVTIQAQKVETNAKAKFYGAEYMLTTVEGKSFERLANLPGAVDGMSYPAKNDFIPDKLPVVKEEPSLIRDDDIAKIWFKFDHRFKQPKVFLKLQIETPLVYDTVDNLARSKLYDAALQEGLNEIVYPIQLAGLSYGLGITKKGMTLTVGGYSARISDLLRLVTRNLTNIKIDQQKFNNIKEAMVRGVKNRKMAQAYSRASYYNRQIWMVKQYNEEQLIKALESVSLEDVISYAKNLYERVYITGMAHGNWTQKDVLSLVDVLLSEIKSKSLPENERYKDLVEVLDSGENIPFSRKVLDNNNALYYGLQIGEMDLARHAKASLVSSIIESDFYTQMRTNQQLGYIVWSFNNRVEDRLFLKMIIQSATYGPAELRKRVEAWMKTTEKLFSELSDEEFEKHRDSLVVSLEKKGDSIAAVTGELYYYATEEKGNFKYKDQIVDVVKKLKKEDVVAAAKEIFLESQTPRVVVLIQSKNNEDPLPKGALVDVSQFKNRK